MGVFDFLSRKKKPVPSRRAGGKAVTTRRYRAPAVGTSEGGWFPSGGLERAPAALPRIRARARDLAENTPYGAAAIRALVGHTVGSGLRLGIAGDDEYRTALSAWASSTDCDYAGQQSPYSLQVTAAETMFAAGDCLLVIRQKGKNGGLQAQIQLIDPDQIDESASPRYKGNEVLSGVEVDAQGKVIGYHVKRAVDSSLVSSWETEFIYLYPGPAH